MEVSVFCPQSQKRELLLSMALDYNIVGFVLSCLNQLAKSGKETI